MQVISSTEFAAHQDKYFDLALSDDICIQKGQKRFLLTYEPIVAEQPILAPDDNLCRAIFIIHYSPIHLFTFLQFTKKIAYSKFFRIFAKEFGNRIAT